MFFLRKELFTLCTERSARPSNFSIYTTDPSWCLMHFSRAHTYTKGKASKNTNLRALLPIFSSFPHLHDTSGPVRLSFDPATAAASMALGLFPLDDAMTWEICSRLPIILQQPPFSDHSLVDRAKKGRKTLHHARAHKQKQPLELDL